MVDILGGRRGLWGRMLGKVCYCNRVNLSQQEVPARLHGSINDTEPLLSQSS